MVFSFKNNFIECGNCAYIHDMHAYYSMYAEVRGQLALPSWYGFWTQTLIFKLGSKYLHMPSHLVSTTCCFKLYFNFICWKLLQVNIQRAFNSLLRFLYVYHYWFCILNWQISSKTGFHTDKQRKSCAHPYMPFLLRPQHGHKLGCCLHYQMFYCIWMTTLREKILSLTVLQKEKFGIYFPFYALCTQQWQQGFCFNSRT